MEMFPKPSHWAAALRKLRPPEGRRGDLSLGERLLFPLSRFPFAQRLSFKLSMIIIWLGLGTILLMTFYFLEHEQEIFSRELEKRGVSIASTLALQAVEPVLEGDRYALFERLKMVVQLQGQDREESVVEYAQVLNRWGEVLAFRQVHSSKDDPQQAPLPEEVLSAKKPLIRPRGENLLDITAPLLVQGEPVGVARVGITKKYLRHTLGRVQVQILFSILGIVAGGIFLGIWLTHKIVRPLKSLKEGAFRVGQGDFGHRVPVTSRDEIGELTETFNQMSSRLAESVEKIKEAQQQLLRSEKLSALGQLSAGLAHELKNPLTSIKMIIEAIQEDPQETTCQDLDILLKEIRLMDGILTRFLEFARPGTLHRQPVDLAGLVEEVLELMRRELEEGKITVDFSVPRAAVVVWVDRSKIKQALLNLILNARQAMSGGGRLRIWADPNGTEGQVCLNIEDNGNGIAPQAIDRVFDPFYTTKEKGVGLGLSIVYSILKEHGGRVAVQSAEGRSTLFQVYLPTEKERTCIAS